MPPQVYHSHHFSFGTVRVLCSGFAFYCLCCRPSTKPARLERAGLSLLPLPPTASSRISLLLLPPAPPGRNRQCYGLNYVTPKRCAGVLNPCILECDLIGIQGLYRGDQMKTRHQCEALTRYDWYSYKKGKFRQRQTRMEGDSVKTRGEGGRDEMQWDPMVLPPPPPALPSCSLPAFCLRKNFSQRVRLIREVRKCRSKEKQSNRTKP